MPTMTGPKSKYYFNTRDLVFMATLVALQAIISFSMEPLVRGLVHGILHLPGPGTGQAIFGGFLNIMWILLTYGLTLKKGSTIVTCIFMGMIHLFIGIGPLTGFPVFFVYLATGLFVELGLLLKPLTVKYLIGGALGNTAFFLAFVGLMGYYKGKWMLASFFPIAIVAGIVSGLLGGLAAVSLLKSLERAGLMPLEEKKEEG